MDNGTPRRWRFQMHLSTAVVLMFVAGAIIWANVNESRRLPPDMVTNEPLRVFGWPSTCVTIYSALAMGKVQDVPVISYEKLTFNCALAFSILLTAYLLCEWLILWRAARRRV